MSGKIAIILLPLFSSFLAKSNAAHVAAPEDIPENLSCKVPLYAICIVAEPSEEYKLKNDKTTFYVCRGHQCLPPVNDLEEALIFSNTL